MGHRCDSRQSEFTREAHSVEASPRIDAHSVVATVEHLVADRAAPAHLRTDNGSELISAALRDWCRIWGTPTVNIEPGASWETPFVESFNSRLRDECCNTDNTTCSLRSGLLFDGLDIKISLHHTQPRPEQDFLTRDKHCPTNSHDLSPHDPYDRN
ncbi:MAG: transposase family protein [Acidimicrobiia bacterium]|nr:transposase family protein [Acidimicrobiia bacterium]MYC46360.1 transposase family protein [Acidimicrobiia bacterium]MYI19412.1 transposase family protein [Acidimicrobiia bacterium]